MKRLITLACLFIGLAVVTAADAGAAPAGVEVGTVRLSKPVDGRVSVLVPVTYPIALAGHRVKLGLSIFRSGHGTFHYWETRPLASGGPLRVPDRRRSFTFVHRIDLGRKLTRELRRGWAVRADAHAVLDANRDGLAELDVRDQANQALALAPGGPTLCSTVPLLNTRPGKSVAVALPACSVAAHWVIAQRPEHGTARIRDGRLIYRSAAKFRGTDSIEVGSVARRGRRQVMSQAQMPVEVKVGTAQSAVVRAMGDSVTAGFGYYDDGTPMPLENLLECRPGEKTYDDACSSNSAVRNNKAKKVEYAADYGLANNVSWAAQWANEHGITNFENLAVSGSEPSDWLPEGQFYATTKRIEAENPDYVLLTLGANPLLSNMLFGIEEMGCAIYSDLFGGYEECIEEAFAGVKLRANLKAVYTELVKKTSATIFLMQYHLAIPSTALAYSASQIAEMGKLMNREIASVAAEVSPTRLQVVTPPHFNVGIDISPVYPSTYSCSRLGFEVDGPSVQTEASQDELLVLHPLSFCSGPESGPPWVISGDTGIHPSATGYTQMASRVPAPK